MFALAFGYGGEGGLLLVKLPVTGNAVTTVLKRESNVPRFLSGLTGALRYESKLIFLHTSMIKKMFAIIKAKHSTFTPKITLINLMFWYCIYVYIIIFHLSGVKQA